MKIHEYQAREIFQKAGIPFTKAEVAGELSRAKSIAAQLGFPVVLKAQVLAGGRGKAGGVKIARDEAELETAFHHIKGLNIKGYSVEQILIATAVDIKKEFYLGITIDNARNDVVVIASSAGGVDIEEVAQKTPEKIQKFYLQGQREIDLTRWPPFIEKVFDDPVAREKGTDVFQKMLKTFWDYDCSLAEINPYIIDAKATWLALDAKMNFDDNALFRHPEIAPLCDMKSEDPEELEAKSCDLSFVKLDGNIGCIVNGAGLAMATMDVIKLLGGRPANFLDVGGSSNPEKVCNALRIILKNSEVKAVLINIFGGITRCDDIARGIVEAGKRMKIGVPMVVRLTGTNEEQGVAILRQENFTTYSSMREAVTQVVSLSNKN